MSLINLLDKYHHAVVYRELSQGGGRRGGFLKNFEIYFKLQKNSKTS